MEDTRLSKADFYCGRKETKGGDVVEWQKEVVMVRQREVDEVMQIDKVA
jgi:hypothetical protein